MNGTPTPLHPPTGSDPRADRDTVPGAGAVSLDRVVTPTNPTWWRPVLGDGALAALIFALSTPLPARTHRPELLPLLLALTIPLLWRRRYPVAVFAVVSLAAFVQWLTIPNVGPYDFAVLVALYSMAAYVPLRWSAPALAVGLLGGFLAWYSVYTHRGTEIVGLVSPTVVVTAVWLLGRTLRTRRRYLAELEERAGRLERERDALARAAVAEERARIAREMHDVVAHSVAVMVAQSEGASVAVHTAPEQAERALAVISDAGRTALAELRRMLTVLREEPAPQPQTTQPQTWQPHVQPRVHQPQADQPAAPQPGLPQLDALVESLRASGLPVRFTREGADWRLDPTLELAVYRIVQESLTNALKHAGPHTPTELVCRRTSTTFEIHVVDQGEHRATVPVTSGHGLTGMRERVAMFGGRFSAGPTPAGGWHVRVELPAS